MEVPEFREEYARGGEEYALVKVLARARAAARHDPVRGCAAGEWPGVAIVRHPAALRRSDRHAADRELGALRRLRHAKVPTELMQRCPGSAMTRCRLGLPKTEEHGYAEELWTMKLLAQHATMREAPVDATVHGGRSLHKMSYHLERRGSTQEWLKYSTNRPLRKQEKPDTRLVARETSDDIRSARHDPFDTQASIRRALSVGISETSTTCSATASVLIPKFIYS